MARRRVFPRHWEKHASVYARTTDTWTTRYYNRKQDPIFNLLGLSTAPDDFHKPEGSSPYLTNIRHMGEREEEQRAQSMSRKGAELVVALGEDIFDRNPDEANTYLSLFEGRAIEWELTHSRKLTGISLHLQNFDKVVGALEITVRHPDTKQELANAVLITDDISENRFTNYRLRFIQDVPQTRVLIRARIIDSLTDEERESGEQPKSLRILAIAGGEHQRADYRLPNVNDALEEEPYTWETVPLLPLAGTMVNDWEILKRPEEFRTAGVRHLAVPVRHDGIVEIWGVNLETKVPYVITSLVNSSAQSVRFAQAEGFLYYVDGERLKRINLTTMEAEVVVPKAEDITVPGVNPGQLTAKEGATLIHYFKNRIYLSGFKDDPNFVQVSLIDSVKPRFDQFNDGFYSPDQSPELSTDSPITAMADINDYVVIFRTDGLSAYDYGSGTSASDSRQVTPEGAQLGVENPECVTKANNNLYFYNKKVGLVRFAGSVNRTLGSDIENLISKIKNHDNVSVAWDDAAKAVRIYCSFDGEQNDRCIYYYSELEGRLPFYMDTNTPVSTAVQATDQDVLYGFHSGVANVMIIDSPNKYTDYDSYIVMEQHTQYRVPPTSDVSGTTYIRRLHLHELAGKRHSVYIALDVDHKDRPIVWRRFIDVPEEDAPNPDAVFQQTAEPGKVVISIPMYVACNMYQVRFKRYCYRDSGEILGVGIEYGDRKPI